MCVKAPKSNSTCDLSKVVQKHGNVISQGQVTEVGILGIFSCKEGFQVEGQNGLLKANQAIFKGSKMIREFTFFSF